jgi:hypothetical protein
MKRSIRWQCGARYLTSRDAGGGVPVPQGFAQRPGGRGQRRGEPVGAARKRGVRRGEFLHRPRWPLVDLAVRAISGPARAKARK